MSTHMIKTHSLIMTIAMKTGDFYKKKKDERCRADYQPWLIKILSENTQAQLMFF